jgi:hypothetical protein
VYTLTVSIQGTGKGFVVSDAGAGGTISCPGTCSAQFPDNVSPFLTASPVVGSSFGGFSLNCLEQEHSPKTCQLNHYRNADETVQVTFNLKPRCVVPDVKGLPLIEAKARLRGRHCGVGTIRYAFSLRRQQGHVISQNPVFGWTREQGAKVNLLVGKGRR